MSCKVHAIDVDAVLYACRKALPHLVAAKGNVVNVASISGLAADYGFTAYNSAKAVAINLSRSIAIDFARDGVRVNTVCPGYMLTALTAQMPEKIAKAYAASVQMGRGADPLEIAEAILFLASPRASFVTGRALVVDGGKMADTGQPNGLTVMMGGFPDSAQVLRSRRVRRRRGLPKRVCFADPCRFGVPDLDACHEPPRSIAFRTDGSGKEGIIRPCSKSLSATAFGQYLLFSVFPESSTRHRRFAIQRR